MHLSRPIALPAAGLGIAALALMATAQFAHADDEIVLLEADGFSPENVVISEGDSVTWNNDTEFACTVTFPGGTPAGSYAFPFSLQFDEAGSYEYQCAVVGAATFTGTVTVEEGEDETSTPTLTATPGTETPTATNTPAPSATATNTPTNTPTTAPATASPTTAVPTTPPSGGTAIPTPIPPATGTGASPGSSATATMLLAALALVGGGAATLATARAARRS